MLNKGKCKMKTKLEKSLLLTSIPRAFFSALQQIQ